MSFLDKIKGAFKKISDLDDVEVSREKKFSDPKLIPYKDIVRELIKAMEESKYELLNSIKVRNYYIISFNPEDWKLIEDHEQDIIEDLRVELFNKIKEFDTKKQKEELIIETRTNASIVNGEIKINSFTKREKAPKQKKKKTKVDDLTQVEVKEKPEDISLPDAAETIVRPTKKEFFYKLEIYDGKKSKTMDISNDEIIIGRNSKKADVRITGSEFVSGEHAKLFFRDQKISLLPLGRNGTIKEGEQLELNKEVELFSKDEFEIENHKFKITVNE